MQLLSVRQVPLLNAMLWFEAKVHRAAIFKFLALWLLSVLPLLLSGLTAPVGAGSNVFVTYSQSVVDEFRATHLFVYATSFMLPMLYLTYERLWRFKDFAFSRKKAPREIDMPEGLSFVLFLAALMFLLTAFAYGTSSRQSRSQVAGGATSLSGSTIVLEIFVSYGLVWLVYLYSLYCWYLTLLMELSPQVGTSFVDATRSGERDLASQLDRRVGDE